MKSVNYSLHNIKAKFMCCWGLRLSVCVIWSRQPVMSVPVSSQVCAAVPLASVPTLRAIVQTYNRKIYLIRKTENYSQNDGKIRIYFSFTSKNFAINWSTNKKVSQHSSKSTGFFNMTGKSANLMYFSTLWYQLVEIYLFQSANKFTAGTI